MYVYACECVWLWVCVCVWIAHLAHLAAGSGEKYNKNIIKLFAGRPLRATRMWSAHKTSTHPHTHTHTPIPTHIASRTAHETHSLCVCGAAERCDLFVYKEKCPKLRLIGYSLSYWNNCEWTTTTSAEIVGEYLFFVRACVCMCFWVHIRPNLLAITTTRRWEVQTCVCPKGSTLTRIMM